MPPRTREELRTLGVVDPALSAELEKHPIRDPQPSDPYYGRDDHEARREHRAARLRELHHLRHLPGPIPDQVEEEDRKIPVRDGAEITVRIYKPKMGEPAAHVQGGRRPLVVMYHEGGWSMGDLSDEEVNCRLFCRDLGAVCVNVNYRLAPEFPFPTWINDSWDALQWVWSSILGFIRLWFQDGCRLYTLFSGSQQCRFARRRSLSRLHCRRWFGRGNIAAVLTHVARDEGLSPPLTGQYLCVPVITCFRRPELIPERYRDEYLSHPGVTQGTDPVLKGDLEQHELFMRLLLQADPESPLFVPFLFGERCPRGHRDLPPAYLQVCGLDPLRDEALVYERILREEAGVRTRLDLYKGLGHYFWTNFPRLEAGRRFVEDTVQGVKWLLEQQRA
ncbi:Lipase 2 [Apiospora saccharicola]